MKIDFKLRKRYLMFVYIVVVGTLILYTNEQAGHPIQETYFFRDQLGQRTPCSDGDLIIARFAFFYGSWIYPLSLINAGLFFWQAIQEKTLAEKLAVLSLAVTCLIFLGRFIELGVFPFAIDSLVPVSDR